MKPLKLLVLALAAVLVSGALALESGGKHFDHLFVIQFENVPFWEVDANKHFQKIAALGTRMTDYRAVEHPSQPNYIAQVAGSGLNVHNDGYITFGPSTRSIVDLIEAKNLTWKGYMENYPGNCFDGDTTGPNRYVRKHNPFIAFENIRNNPRRCSNIVNAQQLLIDLENDALPNFAYFTPGMDNDAHDTNVTFAGEYLINLLPPLLAHPNFFRDTLVVVTWDEDDYTAHNHVSTIVLGQHVRVNHQDSRPYTHYSLLKTLEDNWDLGDLGRYDVNAVPFHNSIYVN